MCSNPAPSTAKHYVPASSLCQTHPSWNSPLTRTKAPRLHFGRHLIFGNAGENMMPLLGALQPVPKPYGALRKAGSLPAFPPHRQPKPCRCNPSRRGKETLCPEPCWKVRDAHKSLLGWGRGRSASLRLHHMSSWQLAKWGFPVALQGVLQPVHSPQKHTPCCRWNHTASDSSNKKYGEKREIAINIT